MPLTRMTLEERTECVRLYSVYEKPSHVRLVWKKKFETEPPTRKTIVSINRKFDQTGSVADLSRSGRPKTSASADNVLLVEDALKKDPTKSLRALSQDLGINKTSVHRIKRESEKKKNIIQSENKMLKERILMLSKQVDLLQKKLASQEESSQINQDLPKTDDSNTIYLSSNGEQTAEIMKPDEISIDQTELVTMSGITLTPVTSGNTQILHFPHETLQLIEVQCSTQVNSTMDTSEIVNSNAISECGHNSPVEGCSVCLNSFLSVHMS